MECHLPEFAVLRFTPKIEIINSTTAPTAIQRKGAVRKLPMHKAPGIRLMRLLLLRSLVKVPTNC